ncbi:hypothetical protein tb265_20570 [Gemmatimonadetes bacterium T265]|nr:hypothetical protein tb265_20570 [Gemmatimonadetes bacterium T265]
MATAANPVTYAPALDQPGAPLQPAGDPLTSGLGPAAWADRADAPDLTVHGEPKIVPMRVAPNFYIEPRDPDPRGMRMLGCDDEVAGVVADVWVDRAEPQVRYFEVELPAGAAAAAGAAGRRVLIPFAVCKVDRRRGVVRTKSVLARQFANVPATRAPDRVTLLEEDKIMAYYAGGYLYATPARSEPLL